MSEPSDKMERLMQELNDEVLNEFEKRIESLVDGPWEDIRLEIESQTRLLREQNAHRVIDGPSELFLHTCSLLLAGYRVILPLIKDEGIVSEIMGGAMSEKLKQGIEAYLMDRFEITQETPEKAFEQLRLNFKKIGEARFGRSFVYERKDPEEFRSIVNVRKCFFHDFFRANGAPELTLALCIQDDVWMEELNKPKYNLEVNRVSILAEGGDVCCFQFRMVNREP